MENNKTFEILNSIDVNNRTEERNGFTYLSWAWAWAEVKKIYPNATYKIKRFGEAQLPYVYDPNTGYMVFTEVTIEGITHEMWLPVMDSANKAMKSERYTYDTRFKKGVVVEPATMFDVNKAIMRCLVKNLSMFGLGLYIYAGEDLPEESKEKQELKTAIRFIAKEQKKEVSEVFKELEQKYGKAKDWDNLKIQVIKQDLIQQGLIKY